MNHDMDLVAARTAIANFLGTFSFVKAGGPPTPSPQQLARDSHVVLPPDDSKELPGSPSQFAHAFTVAKGLTVPVRPN
jgi:hypothetical protein